MKAKIVIHLLFGYAPSLLMFLRKKILVMNYLKFKNCLDSNSHHFDIRKVFDKSYTAFKMRNISSTALTDFLKS